MHTVAVKPSTVLQKIADNFDELKIGIQPEKLSPSDRKAILEELEKLENLALLIKQQISVSPQTAAFK